MEEKTTEVDGACNAQSSMAPRQRVEYRRWLRSWMWSATNAVAIILGKEPIVTVLPGESPEYSFNISDDEVQSVLRVFNDDRQGGRHSVSERVLPDGRRFVVAGDFLLWAKQRGYPVPNWIAHALSKRQINESDLNGGLAAVKNSYDPLAAFSLIDYFYRRIRSGAGINLPVLVEYLEHAFGLIVRGRSADRAFGLTRSRGEREHLDTTERDVRAAAQVTLDMRRGRRYLEAIGDAANRLFPDGKGDRSVEDAYNEHKEFLCCLSDKLLEGLAR